MSAHKHIASESMEVQNMPENNLRKSILLSSILTLIIFIIELITPQGVSESTLYVVVILTSLLSRNRRVVIIAIIVSTLLTIVGFFLSPESPEFWKSALNRSFAVFSFGVVGLIGINLLRIDKSLKESNQRYRNVLDTMLEGSHIIGFDWRYLYVNETGAKHGRQEQKTLLGKTMMEAYPGIENLSLFPALKNCMELREPASVETEFFYPDGTSGWFEFNVQPVEEGIFILTIEITARKQAEKAFQKLNFELEQRILERTVELKTTNEQLQDELSLRKQIEADLRQSETRYRALFEQSNDAVFILDFQAKHIMVNQHAAEMLGYSLDEIQHLSYTDLSAETQKSEQVMGRLLAGERIPIFERLFRKKNGEVFPVDINAELVRDDLGNPMHIQSVVRDITKRKQDEEAIRHQNKMLSDLHEITLDLLKQKNLHLLLNRIVELSTRFLDAEYCELMLIEGEVLIIQAVTENQKELLGERVQRKEAFLSWQAFDTKQPAILSDYSEWTHRREIYNSFSLHAVAGFPILDNEECIGVLAFGRSQSNYEFTEDQIQFGKLFASLTALILNNAQLRETLREQSIRDPLTGVFNRRYMEETFKQTLSRAARRNDPLSIIMLDIDYFKKYNDTFGHQAGDSLLVQVGLFLQLNIRAEDTACRYGGEEFILILPETKLMTAKERAEKICREVTQIKTEKPQSGITISFGVATYPQHGKTIHEIIHAADMALYRAKQNGRNRVEVAESISN